MATKKTAKTTKAKGARYVMVTTAHRGVFAGWLDGEPSKEAATLREARCCVYWDASVRGVVGLAVTGPGPACRVGPAAPELRLQDITAVAVCTDAAREAWERAPWK